MDLYVNGLWCFIQSTIDLSNNYVPSRVSGLGFQWEKRKKKNINEEVDGVSALTEFKVN